MTYVQLFFCLSVYAHTSFDNNINSQVLESGKDLIEEAVDGEFTQCQSSIIIIIILATPIIVLFIIIIIIIVLTHLRMLFSIFIATIVYNIDDDVDIIGYLLISIEISELLRKLIKL